MKLHMPGRTYRILNEMLDAAISGNFVEGDYDESELSRLEVKWKHYLSSSAQARNQVEKEREVLRGLIADISHQTRTPLSNIKLYTDLLKEAELSAYARKLSERLSSQAQRLEFLIQALITMSRLETGIIQVHPAQNPIFPMMESVLEQVQEKALQKQITVKWDRESICAPTMMACFDPKWTAEAIYNVVENGVKYSPEGSVLYIRAEEYEMFVRISVKDQGMGIMEQEQAQIFHRFYRSPRVQEEEGLGLGLYLTREILTQEGGFIKAVAGRGGGSVFQIYLSK